MTLIDVLIILCIIFGVGCLAYWIITKFQLPRFTLIIVGVVLLIVLLVVFFPGAGSYRVWR